MIAPNLAKVSKERIQMELTKLLCSEHPEKIREVYETGISTYVSPAFAALDWQNARYLRRFRKKNMCAGQPFYAVETVRKPQCGCFGI